MPANKTGIVMAVVILALMGLSLTTVLHVPIQNTYKLPNVPSTGPEHKVNITLYADASGWNYNHGKVNPTIVIPPNTLVYFTVIEEDNQPHTLTIDHLAVESTNSQTLLSRSDITTTPGHVSHAQGYFNETGRYTYWCIVHPQTMVGALYVNTSASLTNNTTPPVTYDHLKNVTMDYSGSAFAVGGTKNPSFYIRNNTFLNFSINDLTSSSYSLNFSYLTGVNLSNSTSMISSTNKSHYGGFYFQIPGIYSYWNYYNRSGFGLIYVYSSNTSTTLTANLNGWDYPSINLNPTLAYSQFELVNFTLINGDNLTHTLVINPGSSKNSSYSAIATVVPGENSTSVLYFFEIAGNYTYWDSFHPSTSVGLIKVSSSTPSTGGFLSGTLRGISKG